MMKIPRSNRRNVFEYYAITTDVKLSSFLATMHNISQSGALLKVFGELLIEEHIYACPIKDEETDDLPTPDKIVHHPHVISGTVVRKEGMDSYGIQFEHPTHEGTPASYQKTTSSRSTSWESEENGYTITLRLNNTPDLSTLIRFRDTLREQSHHFLHMLLDFSHSGKLPTMGYAILGEMLEDLAEANYRIALVNENAFGNTFLKKFQYSNQIHFFDQEEEAQKYLNQHALKAVIIDDEETTLQLINAYLQKRGFQVFSFKDAEQALPQLEKHQPDIILMDIHLPGMNGLQATNEIRNNHQLQHIPVIILTGESHRQMVSESIRLQVNDYLLKPLDSHNLMHKIISVLKQNENSENSENRTLEDRPFFNSH